MNNEGQRRPRGLSHVHLRHRDTNADAGPLFIVWCEQNRNQIAKKRRFVLPARYGANQILGPSQGHQPAGEVVHHLFFGRGRARGDLSQSSRDLQQVLHSVAHLARKQLVGFLSLLALRDVKEDAEHKTIRYVSVVALPPSGYPADVAP